MYETLVATREDKEDRLEALERTLDERRGYLNSLREDQYVDSEAEIKDDMDSAVDTHIEKKTNGLDFLDDWKPHIKDGSLDPRSSESGIYKISDNEEYKQKVEESTEFLD